MVFNTAPPKTAPTAPATATPYPLGMLFCGDNVVDAAGSTGLSLRFRDPALKGDHESFPVGHHWWRCITLVMNTMRQPSEAIALM